MQIVTLANSVQQNDNDEYFPSQLGKYLADGFEVINSGFNDHAFWAILKKES